jgi:hypothetical protein
MKIFEVYSQLGGLEFIKVHKPELWSEIDRAIASVDGHERGKPGGVVQPASWATRIRDGLTRRGWTARREAMTKSGIDIEIYLANQSLDRDVLFARHRALYQDGIIDVGIEILPMKELETQMSSGPAYYEGELYNLIREGRGVPGVPLVLVGIAV